MAGAGEDAGSGGVVITSSTAVLAHSFYSILPDGDPTITIGVSEHARREQRTAGSCELRAKNRVSML
jgi:hypothetical protein